MMTEMTCERFEAILPDYFEGDLSDEAKAAADVHARSCASCAKTVAEVRRIASDASALPAMRPVRDLWPGIEQRISAPVFPLAEPARRANRFASRWIAAAAAALIVTTAGITYLATARTAMRQPARVATVTPKPATPAIDSNAAATNVSSGSGTPSVVASATDETGATTNRATGGQPTNRTRPAALASNPSRTVGGGVNNLPTGSLASTQADATYDREIAILEKMVASPKSGLDSATIQVVNRNLKVIDDAIAQSKAALAKDPASTLLYDQITRAMSKKVELLRTIASLSSST